MGIVASLRRARRRSGMSLRALAERSGVASSNLSMIENGRRDPTASTVDKVASAIGIEWIPVLAEGRSPAARAAAEIIRADDDGHFAQAYRRFLQLNDELASADPVTKVLLSAEAPDTSSSRWLDAIAALVEVRLLEVSAPVPFWVTEREGRPDVMWEPRRSSQPLPVSAELARVSPSFLDRGIAIEDGELVSI
ncbi:helix-turn-helix domain-containing protein [Microbacterium sp. GXS0129]|uniref:helix-turn-helix domain-containing protein n=1 Tax=Microbacterium sp. GXS0129 TaxID=3377836 RepID=UPI00383A730F